MTRIHLFLCANIIALNSWFQQFRLLTSFKMRASYKNIERCLNLKCKIHGFVLKLVIVYSQRHHIKKIRKIVDHTVSIYILNICKPTMKIINKKEDKKCAL